MLGRNRVVNSAFAEAAQLTDATHISAVNTLEADLKNASLWDKLVAVYPIVGGTAHAHKFNLKDPRDLDEAYRMTIPVGWIHSGQGFKVDLSAGQTFVPMLLFDDWNISFNAYSVTDSVDSSMIFFATNVQIALKISNTFLSDMHNFLGTDSRVSASNTVSTGFYSVVQTPQYNHRIFKNGNLLASKNVFTSGTHSGTIAINGKQAVADGRISSFLAIGHGLTDAEVSTLDTIVQTYQTNLGREITR